MSTTETRTLHVNGPADLLGAVPYLLGFHPEESLVIIGLNKTKVVVTARLDLADIAGSRVLADTLAAIKRGHATAVVGAVFTETPVPSEPIAAHLDAQKTLAAGFTPFLFGDVLKLVIAAGLLPVGWWIVRRRDEER